MHGNLPPRLPGAISGQRQNWKTPSELGVNKSMECAIFPFSALTLLVGRQEGHPACKKTRCLFVGGDDFTGVLHDLWLWLSPSPPSSLASIYTG